MTGSPSEWQILGLGAFAGLTIFLGLAVGLRRTLSPAVRAFLSAFAAGILLFLFFDVLQNANAGIEAQIPAQGGGDGTLAVAYLAILLVGWSVGFLSLGAFEKLYVRRLRSAPGAAPAPAAGGGASFAIDALAVSTMIAIGIGCHNFSEGLAIGTAYAGGAITAGTVLAIGFATHNATEGFGILGPGLLAGRRYSVRRLGALGLVGGGPTLLGTVVGSVFYSEPLSILFYGLAAGAIIYVVLEMIRPMMGAATRTAAWFGIVFGFILGVVTDALVSFGGA